MISIILSHPQMGENIGAAARAMQNFGLSDLRLVKPRDGWPNPRAETTASGALENMPEPKVFHSLSDAIKDLHFVYATTARPRDMVKPLSNPTEALEDAHQRSTNGQAVGVVFGGERAGLENNEICKCQSIIYVPTNPGFSSLNLAQCVLLICYEWGKASQYSYEQEVSAQMPAKLSEIENFMDRLLNDLEVKKFFRAPDLKPTMQRNIENIFTRAELTEQELRTLHGILSALRGNKGSK